MIHDFKDGDRVALKWQVNRKGVAPAETVRKGTVHRPPGWDEGGVSRPFVEVVAVRMDDSHTLLRLHYTMWRRLDLIELVGEVK